MNNTYKTLIIILATIIALFASYHLLTQSPSTEPTTDDTATTTDDTLTGDDIDYSTGTLSEEDLERKRQSAQNIRDISDAVTDVEIVVDQPAGTTSTLSEWLSAWRTVRPDLSFDDFRFTGTEDFGFPFNEVSFDGREDATPGFDEASAYSPNGQMYLNYLYHYLSDDAFSGVILVNPRGEDRLFRVAFCNNFCEYHFARWLSDTEFVVAALMEDTRECKDTPYDECAETLVYDIYDLDTMTVTHFTHRENLGNLRAHFPDAVCDLYSPCYTQN